MKNAIACVHNLLLLGPCTVDDVVLRKLVG